MDLSDILNRILEIKHDVKVSSQINSKKQKTLVEALEVLEEIINLEL